MDDEDKVFMAAERIKGSCVMYAVNHPKLYRDDVRNGRILDIPAQERISEMDRGEFLAFLMDRQISCSLNVYPDYATDVLRDFDREIVQSLESLVRIREDDLPSLRKKLGLRGCMAELEDWGDYLYARAQRDEKEVMMRGPEFRVTEAVQIDGPQIFSTWVGGFYGFLKFYRAEVEQIAPAQANAHLLGPAWTVEISNGKFWSPITAGNHLNVNQEDGIYHIAPIQFFDAVVDRNTRYEIATEVLERDEDGNVARFKMWMAPIDIRQSRGHPYKASEP